MKKLLFLIVLCAFTVPARTQIFSAVLAQVYDTVAYSNLLRINNTPNSLRRKQSTQSNLQATENLGVINYSFPTYTPDISRQGSMVLTAIWWRGGKGLDTFCLSNGQFFSALQSEYPGSEPPTLVDSLLLTPFERLFGGGELGDIFLLNSDINIFRSLAPPHCLEIQQGDDDTAYIYVFQYNQ